MKSSGTNFFVFIFILTFSLASAFSQKLYKPTVQLWKPEPDKVYLQEVGQKIPTSGPVKDVSVLNGKCFAIVDHKVAALSGNTFKEVTGSPSDVERLKTLKNSLWVLSKNGLYQYQNEQWKLIDKKIFTDVCTHLDHIYGATKEAIYHLENGIFKDIMPDNGYNSSDITMLMEDGTQVHADPVRIGPIDRIQSYNGTLYILRPGKIILLDGDIVDTDHIDWGKLPSKHTRDMLSFGSKLYVTTDRGLGELRGPLCSD